MSSFTHSLTANPLECTPSSRVVTSTFKVQPESLCHCSFILPHGDAVCPSVREAPRGERAVVGGCATEARVGGSRAGETKGGSGSPRGRGGDRCLNRRLWRVAHLSRIRFWPAPWCFITPPVPRASCLTRSHSRQRSLDNVDLPSSTRAWLVTPSYDSCATQPTRKEFWPP